MRLLAILLGGLAGDCLLPWWRLPSGKPDRRLLATLVGSLA